MLDIMYEIPKDSNIGSVTITEDVVERRCSGNNYESIIVIAE